jgi:hypothetical protein
MPPPRKRTPATRPPDTSATVADGLEQGRPLGSYSAEKRAAEKAAAEKAAAEQPAAGKAAAEQPAAGKAAAEQPAAGKAAAEQPAAEKAAAEKAAADKAAAEGQAPTPGRAGADFDPLPCGRVDEHDLPDLADARIPNGENIRVCGDAHYIYQLGADVRTAVTVLAEDFLEGKFAPDTRPTQDLLCGYVTARPCRVPGEYVTKILDTTFSDMWVDELMNGLAATFDAFERSCPVWQPETARPVMRSARHTLLREIRKSQLAFSDKGGGGLRLVVHQAGAELTDGLKIAVTPEVQCHAGVHNGDPIATLAALSDQPEEAIRIRALKASAVRYVASKLASFPDQPHADITNAALGELSDSLSDYQAASGRTSDEDTMTPSDAVAEGHRLAVLSRQAVLMPFR